MNKKISDVELNKLFTAVDVDGSGKLEYTEFIIACTDKAQLLSDENLEICFKMMDKDGNGMITKKDISNIFGEFNLHDRVVGDLLKSMDKDNDGKISKEDYLKLMRHASSDNGAKKK